jgi:hypothetical protein
MGVAVLLYFETPKFAQKIIILTLFFKHTYDAYDHMMRCG